MAGLDGGTKQKGKVAGSLAVIPSKTEVEAGDEITVDVYAADAKNVNALGALVNFKSDQFEFVSESIAQDGSTAGMENLSREKVQFADRTQTINLAFGQPRRWQALQRYRRGGEFQAQGQDRRQGRTALDILAHRSGMRRT